MWRKVPLHGSQLFCHAVQGFKISFVEVKALRAIGPWGKDEQTGCGHGFHLVAHWFVIGAKTHAIQADIREVLREDCIANGFLSRADAGGDEDGTAACGFQQF